MPIRHRQRHCTKKITSSRQLIQFLRPRVSRQPYLIQEGLKLAGFNSSPVDFRILTQKDGNDQWRVTSMVARVAQNNTVVTNVARGGNVHNVKTILPHLTRQPPQHAQQRLRQLALAVSNELESRLDGNYAQFGIDVAMDIYGNLWLLEVNAKPSKETKTASWAMTAIPLRCGTSSNTPDRRPNSVGGEPNRPTIRIKSSGKMSSP